MGFYYWLTDINFFNGWNISNFAIVVKATDKEQANKLITDYADNDLNDEYQRLSTCQDAPIGEFDNEQEAHNAARKRCDEIKSRKKIVLI